MANIFDILGPVMVGPSSSHTAGVVKIGNICRQLLGTRACEAEIYLHGSLASTGKGHGTDRAIIAGLLGLKPDDMRISDSFEIAKEEGLNFTISAKEVRGAHPNTVLMTLHTRDQDELKVQASSVGGGRIMINKIDDIDVNFNAESNTLIVHNMDKPGRVAEVSGLLSENRVNIATMQLYRNKRNGYAVMVLETDQTIPAEVVEALLQLDGIIKVTFLNVSQPREEQC